MAESPSTNNTSDNNFLSRKFQGVCNYLERETVGAELVIYGASGLMLLVAYAKRKPTYLIRQFKKPSHIPDRVINERVIHRGIIQNVQQNGPDTLLLINHRPWISLFANRSRVLSVKLPGVQVNANGFSWLQNCIVGREATFVPMANGKMRDFVVSQLCLIQPPNNKVKGKLLDISEILLKLRFAKFAADAAASAKQNAKYYQHLQQTEVKTQSKEAWFAWAAQHPWMWAKLHELKASLVPKQKMLPELVR